MPYYKVYSKDEYKSNVEELLMKIAFDRCINKKKYRNYYNLNSLSNLYEIVLGIVSSLIDLKNIEHIKHISSQFSSIRGDEYDNEFVRIFGKKYLVTFHKLNSIRNTFSHSIADSMRRSYKMINSLDYLLLIKFLLEVQKKSGMGRELAICVYEMFKEDINVKDLFDGEDDYEHFEIQLNEYMKDSEFELALEYLLLRS